MSHDVPVDEGKGRLEQLSKQWSEQANPSFFDKFTPADLRLMLEHFQPLQQLIQTVAQGQEPSAAAAVQPESKRTVEPSQNEQELKDTIQGLEKALRSSQEECTRLQQQAEHDKEQLKQASDSIQSQTALIESLQQKLATLTAEHEKQQAQLTQDIQAANAHLQQTQSKLQQQQQQVSELSQQLSTTQAQLREFQPPAELTFLRNEPELMQALGLSLPDSNQQALIAMVAVLAQKDNLERLWDNLKDRCESEKRPATHEEDNLLNAALAWYNHNWKTRPFQLLTPTAPSGYNFETQQKLKHQTDGETVSQVWLAGIADGAGKPLRKTLVLTQ